MPSSIADENDGVVVSGPLSTWVGARDATSGTANNSGQNTTGVGSNGVAARGGGTNFNVKRSFFEFDFTGVTNVATATLKLKNPQSSPSIVRIVKVGDFAPLSDGDFDNIVGFSAGNTMAGNVTDFIDTAITLAANSTTDFTLNSTAIADMNSNDKFRIGLVGNTYDYLNVTPSSGDTNEGGITFANTPGTEDDPQIEYTVTAPSERSPQAGGTFTRFALRTRNQVGTIITARKDYEFKLKNNLKSQVYFNIEGVNNKDIFTTASLRTTTSDSGSNVVNFISESQHVSFILKSNSTSSFLLSSSVDIPGNSMEVIATNLQMFNAEDKTASGSTFGVSMELISD